MAEIKEITVVDFIDWCKQQVDLSDLSALMTDFGYADDSSETIVDALDDAEFKAEFSYLLKQSLTENKSYFDQQRADGELTANDWIELAKANSFVGVAGSTQAPWWQTVLGVIGPIMTQIGNPVVPETAAQIAARLKAAEDAKKSSTFTWIIVAVVVIAVISILLLATRKK